jgi:hypothetical protein
LIISTSIVGAYMFIRGISFFAGKFPNEFVIVDLIENNIITSIDPAFYGYLAGILVFALIGIIVQYRMKSSD